MNIDNVEAILEKIKILDIEDPIVYEYWEELAGILSKNEKTTIEFLRNCSEDEVESISAVFEDIAYKLQSKQFIECLEQLSVKYPNSPLKESIKTAKDYML